MTSLLTQQQAIFKALKEANVSTVYVYMSGAGDSGEICMFDYADKEGKLIQHSELQQLISFTWKFKKETYEFKPTIRKIEYIDEGTTIDMPLHEAVDDLVTNMVEETGVDWYNNEGGSGTVNIDVDELSIAIAMTQNMETEVYNNEFFFGVENNVN